jgi:hypothetical protein
LNVLPLVPTSLSSSVGQDLIISAKLKGHTICIQTNIAEAGNAVIASAINHSRSQHTKLEMELDNEGSLEPEETDLL